MNTQTIIPHVESLITKIWAHHKAEVKLPKVKYNKEGQTTWVSKREFGPLWDEFIINLTNMLEPTTLGMSQGKNSCTIWNSQPKKSVRDMTPSEEQVHYNEWYKNVSLWQTKDLLKKELNTDIYVDLGEGTLTIKEDEEILLQIVEWLEANPSMQGHYLCTQMITSYEIVDLEPRDQWFTREKTTTYTDEYQQQKALIMEVNHMPICGRAKVSVWASCGEQVTIRTDFPISFKEMDKAELELNNKKSCFSMLRWRLNQEEHYTPSYISTDEWNILFDYTSPLTAEDIKSPQCSVPTAYLESQKGEELGGIPKSIFKNL